MTIDPVVDPDQVVENVRRKSEDRARMKGMKAMHYGAFRTDKERL